MKINIVHSLLSKSLRKYLQSLISDIKFRNLKIPDKVGLFKYITISEFEHHYVIEFLGVQKITNNANFVIENKLYDYDINYFINGGIEKNDYSSFNAVWDFKSHKHLQVINVCSSVTINHDLIKRFFKEDLQQFPIFHNQDSNLPFLISEDTHDIYFQNIHIISKLDTYYSYRKHSSTLIISKKVTEKELKIIFNRQLNINNIRSKNSITGLRTFSFVIGELKTLAYLKVHETTIDRFLQLNSIFFAKSLGYKSAKSNVNLELKVHKNEFDKNMKLIPDFMLEKSDGYYDILDLKIGLLSFNFALGNWSNARFSSYGQKLLGQLKGYERYFSFKENAEWVYKKYGIKIREPKLIGIAGNHNNFNHEVVRLALENHSNDFVLYSYNDLSELMEKVL